MEKSLAELTGHFIVCGFGRMGSASARSSRARAFPSSSWIRPAPARGFRPGRRHRARWATRPTTTCLTRPGSSGPGPGDRPRLRRRQPVHHHERPAAEREAVHRGPLRGGAQQQKLLRAGADRVVRPIPSAGRGSPRPYCAGGGGLHRPGDRARSTSSCRWRSRAGPRSARSTGIGIATACCTRTTASSSWPSRRRRGTWSTTRPATRSCRPATRSIALGPPRAARPARRPRRRLAAARVDERVACYRGVTPSGDSRHG